MTTRRRHTTCAVAAALALGLLASTVGPGQAHAASRPLTRAGFLTYLQRVRTIDGSCLSVHDLLAHPFPRVTPLWNRNQYVTPARVRPLVDRLATACNVYAWSNVPEPVGAEDVLGWNRDWLGETYGYINSVALCVEELHDGRAADANRTRLVAVSDYALFMSSLRTLARHVHVTVQPW